LQTAAQTRGKPSLHRPIEDDNSGLLLYNGLNNAHYISLYGGAGYSTLRMNIQSADVKGGLGALAGIGYELDFMNNFQMGIGAEWYYINNSATADNFSIERNFLDTHSKPFTMIYEYTRYKEQQAVHYINLFPHFTYYNKKYYVQAGLKAGLNFKSYYNIQTNQRTTADYPQYVDDFEDMPNHFLDNSAISQRYPISFSINVAASIEAGVYIYTKQGGSPRSLGAIGGVSPFRLRVGAFLDYGLINITRRTDRTLIEYNNAANPLEITAGSIVESTRNSSGQAHTFMAGIKLTALIMLQSVRRCKCDYLVSE
jgi:hypothetical protein